MVQIMGSIGGMGFYAPLAVLNVLKLFAEKVTSR